MDSQTRLRPILQPLWTDYQNLDGYPKTAFRLGRSPLLSASPATARSPPSPMHPASAGYDPAMRKHERALLESFDQRSVQTPASARGAGQSFTPDAEQTARLDWFAMGAPTAPQMGDRTPTCLHQAAQTARRRTIIAETRSMLLSGMPETAAGDVGIPVDRRSSVQAVTSLGAVSTPTTPTPRRNSRVLREHLQAWGHVHFGNGTSADCFVAAVALRRPNDSSSADETADANKRDPGKSNQLTVRVRVRPRALDRKPFLIQRTFNVDELRSTIPDPSPITATSRRLSVDQERSQTAISSAYDMRRRSTTAVAHRLPPDEKSVLHTSKMLLRGAGNVVPIHLQYARLHLPVLAALMLSGHIRQGDIVDLPMPHPEAWIRTVAHIYTGQGKVIEAMKQNILYLAGNA